MPLPTLRPADLTLGLALLAATPAGPAAAQPAASPADATSLPGWELVWSDEFDGPVVDAEKWEVLNRKRNHNNEKQYYLPQQATVEDGMLVITSTDEPYDGRDYRSARLFSYFSLTHGRVEARAKVPTGKGIWPAIWLVPRRMPWPTGGEIDILEHKGSQPTMVSSAYHFANDQGRHTYQSHRHRPEPPVRYPDGFHTFAVEWDPGVIRFYADGVNHFTVAGPHVSDTPMSVVLNTAVFGWFDGDPDDTTVFPQRFLIDYVRVWKRTGPAPEPPARFRYDGGLLQSGSFEGRSTGWTFTDQAYHQAHNDHRTPMHTAVEGPGGFAVKMHDRGRAAQRVPVEPGQGYRLSAKLRTNADDSIRGSENRVTLSLRFLDAAGEPIGRAEAVGLDGGAPEDQWVDAGLTAAAPAAAAEAEVAIAFERSGEAAGAVWLDQVALHPAR